VSQDKAVTERKAVYKATRELAKAIADRGKNTAVSPDFFDEFTKELGGARGLGKRLANDFKRISGEGLTEAEQAFFTHDEKTLQRYWQMLSTFMQQQDRMNSVDITSLSDEELQATLSQLAMSLIAKDDAFRKGVIKACVTMDRDFIEELAQEAGLLGPSIDAEASPQPLIEESDEAEDDGEAMYPDEV
jgi:hypothetical protein